MVLMLRILAGFGYADPRSGLSGHFDIQKNFSKLFKNSRTRNQK
jgi:hypothetical protein